MSTVLTREDIFAIDDRVIEFVAVPEWSPDNPEAGIFVRGLSGTDRDSFEVGMIDEKRDKKGRRSQEINLRNLRAKLIVRCAVDSDDPDTAQPIFTLVDIEPLGRKSGAALQRVYEVAQRLSGLSNEAVEELTEDLGEGQSDASGSDLPSPSGIEASQMLNTGSPAPSSPSGLPSTGLSQSETDD